MVTAATPVTKVGVVIPKPGFQQGKPEEAQGNPPTQENPMTPAPKPPETMVVKPKEDVEPKVNVLCLEENLIRFGPKWIPLYKGRKIQLTPDEAEYLADLGKVKILAK